MVREILIGMAGLEILGQSKYNSLRRKLKAQAQKESSLTGQPALLIDRATIEQLKEYSESEFCIAISLGAIEKNTHPDQFITEMNRIAQKVVIRANRFWIPSSWLGFSNKHIHKKDGRIDVNPLLNWGVVGGGLYLLNQRERASEFGQAIERGRDFYHLRYRDPDQFVQIRTPDWAEHVADSIAPGSLVRTGELPSGEWRVQNVMIPLNYSETKVRDLADRIVAKIERRPLEAGSFEGLEAEPVQENIVRPTVNNKKYECDYYELPAEEEGTSPRVYCHKIPEEAPAEEKPSVSGVLEGKTHKYAHPSTPEGERAEYEAQYQVVEGNSLIPSHNPVNNFNWNPEYPREIQDRDYSDPELPYQMAVIQKAQNLDPGLVINNAKTSIEGPPVVTPEDIVLSGNSRAMLIQLAAYKYSNQYKKYRRRLIDSAFAFGFDEDNIIKFETPVLVRRIQIPRSEYERFASLANESAAMAMDLIGLTKQVSKYISDEMVSRMAIGEDQTLRAYLRTASGKEFAEAVMAALPQSKQVAYIERGQLTQDGIALIEGVLYYKLIPDTELLEAMPASLKNTVVRAIPEFHRIRVGVDAGSINKKWDITSELPKAVGFWVRNLADQSSLENWLAQMSFMEKEKYEADSLWGQLVVTLDKLKGHTRKFTEFMRSFAEMSEGMLFEADPIETLKKMNEGLGERYSGLGAFNQIRREGIDWWSEIREMKEEIFR